MALEDYTIVERIGQGGAGLTHLVRNSEGVKYCLKEFRFGMRKGEGDTFKARELFEREARTLRGLNHPQIPSYLDFFIDDSNGEERLYLVMEYVPGDTLEQLATKQKFNEQDAIAIAKKVTNILEYLHSFSPQIIHRDIKPRNLIQTPDSTIKLVDFGSVADKIMYETRSTFTRVGTFGFAAPELYYGEPTPASDIYSLGTTLVWLLSGRVNLADLMNSKHRMDFREKLNVSKRTENLLWDMTEPDLDGRIKDTEELRQRLYGNGALVSQAFRTSDNIAIHYDNIQATYHRVSWRKWDLGMVLDRFNRVFSGVKSVVNDYGREMVASPIEITIEYEGRNAKVHSPEEAFGMLPKKSQQRAGLKDVRCDLKTSDERITGELHYHKAKNVRSGAYGPYDAHCVQASLHVEGFTERNRSEYKRLHDVVHKGSW